MKKKNYPAVNMGSALLLVIFIILCLVTFATLSLSSSTSDFHYSETIAKRNTAYYEASNQAEDILAQLDDTFADSWSKGKASYYTNVEKSLPDIDGLSTDFSTEKPTIIYQVPINDNSALHVEVTVLSPSKNAGHFYQITSWKAVSTQERSGDHTIKVIGG